MSLKLRHLKGVNGSLRGSLRCHPRNPGQLFYVSGAQIVCGSEDIFAPQALFRGHNERITAFAMSNSGELMASGQIGRTSDVLLWNTKSMQPMSRFQEIDREVIQLCFSHDDRLLLAVGHEKDPKVYVLDTSNGKIVSKGVMEFNKRATASAFAPMTNPSAYSFATASDNEIILWTVDPYSGQIGQTKVNQGSVRRSYTSLVFAPDGMWLYAGTTTGDVCTINVRTAAIQMTHPACAGGVGYMILSRVGKLLVAGGDGTITLFSNDHMWREIKPFVTVGGSITSMSSNFDGSSLIVATAQGGIFRVLAGNAAVSVIEQGHAAMCVKDISFPLGNSDSFATSSEDGTVCVWSIQNYGMTGRVHEPLAGAALSVALSPDLIVSGWADGLIRGHARHGAPAWAIPGAHQLTHACGVTALKLSNRGQFIGSGGAGGEIRVWDLRTRGMVGNMKHHQAAITDLTVLADDAHMVASGEDRMWTLWDIGQSKLCQTWVCQTVIRGHAVAPDQVSVVTVGMDRNVSIYDIRSNQLVRSIPGAHAAEIGCVAIDPRGSAIATGGADSMIKLWDWRSLALITTASVHTAAVSKLSFSPSGQQLLSTSAEGSVAIMEVM